MIKNACISCYVFTSIGDIMQMCTKFDREMLENGFVSMAMDDTDCAISSKRISSEFLLDQGMNQTYIREIIYITLTNFGLWS